jgi:hypothetical protein
VGGYNPEVHFRRKPRCHPSIPRCLPVAGGVVTDPSSTSSNPISPTPPSPSSPSPPSPPRLSSSILIPLTPPWAHPRNRPLVQTAPPPLPPPVARVSAPFSLPLVAQTARSSGANWSGSYGRHCGGKKSSGTSRPMERCIDPFARTRSTSSYLTYALPPTLPPLPTLPDRPVRFFASRHHFSGRKRSHLPPRHPSRVHPASLAQR